MIEFEESHEQSALLREIAESLRVLVAWVRVASYPAVEQVLAATLDSDEKRLVYHLTDGHRSVKEIQELSGVNARYISEWGRDWEKMGIAEPSRLSGIKGRRQKVFDLTVFAIQVPVQSDVEASTTTTVSLVWKGDV